jgi:peptidoglycan/xylan/chitin deacetylase (PgdA/CDA1 family)
VLYGSAGIYDCVNSGDMALTFDDGPFIYTSHILDLLDQYNASATFFITGNNNGKSYFKILVLLEITDIETRQRTNR